jgi:hypothetical protein
MAIVDDLLANPGLYVGVDTVVGSDLRGAARMVVSPLPGAAGVTMDYEILNTATPDRIRGRRTQYRAHHDGGAVMARS